MTCMDVFHLVPISGLPVLTVLATHNHLSMKDNAEGGQQSTKRSIDDVQHLERTAACFRGR